MIMIIYYLEVIAFGQRSRNHGRGGEEETSSNSSNKATVSFGLAIQAVGLTNRACILFLAFTAHLFFKLKKKEN